MSDDDYKRGYRDGFKDGFASGKDTIIKDPDESTIKIGPYVWPTPSVKASGCSVCGLEFKGTFEYACQRLDCPYNIVAL